ncbi:MAG: fibronectin type III domain-containing protein [Terriglobia bacterium]
MRKLGTYLATAIIILFFISPSVLLVAGDAILTWNPNTDAVAGYKVYYGTVSHTYGSPIDVGNQTTYTVTGLPTGTYYFAVTAYNSSQNESGFSNEVSKTITVVDTTPPTISATTASSITQTGATITWTTNEASDTQVDYGTTTSYGSSTTLSSSLVTAHSAAVSGLAASTLYHYRVKSRDAAGNLATSGDFTFTTAADTTAPTISSVSASSITQSGATISWTTNEASDTQVEYGTTTAYGSSTTLNSSLVTAHSAPVPGLTASTLYHYRVKSRDAAGNLATSSDFTFTTSADTTAPVISGTAASPVTQSGATISWTTNEASDTQVEYGTTAGYGSSTMLNTSLVTSHSAVLSGLTASSLYHYRVKSRDAAGNLATSGDFTFTTAADTTAPVVSAISASSITLSGATINWTTNEASDTQVDYGTTAGYGSSTTLNTSLVTSHAASLSGLTASTVYHYRVKSRDAVGNLATSGDFTLTTAADATPPTMPTGLSANAASSTQINLSWTASTDNVAVTGYKIFRNSSQITTTAGTSFQDTGLNPSTPYSYTISAYDAAGNNSASSTAASATTQAPPDSTPPVISAVAAAPITSTGATVNWTTDEAADSQVEYGTTPAYGSSTTLDGNRAATHSQLVSGLTSATPYHYRVRSRDAAGNLALSGDFTFTTLSLCDVNGDGGINALDLQAVVNAILSGTNPAKLNINQDGAVDVLDLQILNNVILGVRTCPT